MKRGTVKAATWLLALLPLALVAVLYGRLPDQVPINWGLNGAITYGGKGVLWALALLSPALAALFAVLPRVDPRRKNYQRFQSFYDGMALVLMAFLLCVHAITLTESLRPGTLAVWRVVTLVMGLFLLFLGNMLPKVKSNFFLGVKTPWTLEDPDVWNRSNRLCGLLLFALGVGLIPAALLLAEQIVFPLMLAGVLAAALAPMVMSYVWYRKKHGDSMDKDGSH